MRKLSANHKAEIERYTAIDYGSLTRLTYLWEFDRAYQCPTWGYPTEEAYYRDASSVDALLAVRVPLLALNAADDPIASRWALPYPEARQNPYTVLCTTSLGGHLGWFEVGGGRWHRKPVSTFLSFYFSLFSFGPSLSSYLGSSLPPPPALAGLTMPPPPFTPGGSRKALY